LILSITNDKITLMPNRFMKLKSKSENSGFIISVSGKETLTESSNLKVLTGCENKGMLVASIPLLIQALYKSSLV